MKYTKIEQYIKIKAMDDDNNYLGTFKVSIYYSVPIDYLSEDDFDVDVFLDYDDFSKDEGSHKHHSDKGKEQ